MAHRITLGEGWIEVRETLKYRDTRKVAAFTVQAAPGENTPSACFPYYRMARAAARLVNWNLPGVKTSFPVGEHATFEAKIAALDELSEELGEAVVTAAVKYDDEQTAAKGVAEKNETADGVTA
jgi:hypothetical protein